MLRGRHRQVPPPKRGGIPSVYRRLADTACCSLRILHKTSSASAPKRCMASLPRARGSEIWDKHGKERGRGDRNAPLVPASEPRSPRDKCMWPPWGAVVVLGVKGLRNVRVGSSMGYCARGCLNLGLWAGERGAELRPIFQ